MLSFNLGDCGVVSIIIIKIYTPIIVYPKNTCKIFGSNMSIEQVCHERAYTFSQKMSNEASLNVHSQKMARLVAHHWKKLKFSMGILTFFAIPNKFWKGTGHSDLRGWQNLKVNEKSTDLTKKSFHMVF